MAKHKTRKDRRKKKTGGKSVSRLCQNNGSCVYCKTNRTYKNLKREQAAINQLDDISVVDIIKTIKTVD